MYAIRSYYGFKDLAGKKRAFIVTDRFLQEAGYVAKVAAALEAVGVQSEVFSDVKPDPDLARNNFV